MRHDLSITSAREPEHWTVNGKRIFRFVAHPFETMGPFGSFVAGVLVTLGLVLLAVVR